MTDLINTFAPISLEQMSGVKLMNRTDTKFVTTTERLQLLLQMAQNDYYVQEIDFLDTPYALAGLKNLHPEDLKAYQQVYLDEGVEAFF